MTRSPLYMTTLHSFNHHLSDRRCPLHSSAEARLAWPPLPWRAPSLSGVRCERVGDGAVGQVDVHRPGLGAEAVLLHHLGELLGGAAVRLWKGNPYGNFTVSVFVVSDRGSQ